jgi:hypothetical protein
MNQNFFPPFFVGVKHRKMGAEKAQARDRVEAIVDRLGGFVHFSSQIPPTQHRAGASANPILLDGKADEK